MESRRGFLKTLGKLTAAVGLTAAVASTSAKADTEGTGGGKPIIEKFNYKPRLSARDMFRLEVRDTGKVNNDGLAIRETTFDKHVEHAKTVMDDLANAWLDNASMALNPPMVIPRHVYGYAMRKKAIRSLDPYNWGSILWNF